MARGRGQDRLAARAIPAGSRDELPLPALKILQASKTVAVLQRRELENYLLDAAALAQVLGSLASNGTTEPSAPDIAAAMTDAGETLRNKIVINRVCRQVQPARPLMEHTLRQRLANEGADQEAIMAAILARLMTQDELRTQIKAAWQAAEADVATHSGDELLAIAPGEEILNAVFVQFAGRGYNKQARRWRSHRKSYASATRGDPGTPGGLHAGRA